MVPRPMYMAWDSTPGPGRPHDLGPIAAGFFDRGPKFGECLSTPQLVRYVVAGQCSLRKLVPPAQVPWPASPGEP